MYKNLYNHLKKSIVTWSFFLIACFSIEKVVAQQSYHVGPGQTMTKLSDVPWKSLGPGDVVNIHYSANPYREKILISTSGTTGKPITIIGINGPNGEKPIIDGENAVSAPKEMCFSNTDVFGLIFITPGTDANGQCPGGSYSPIPHDLVIENLEIRNAHPTKKFTPKGGVATAYDVFSAGIYGERVQDLVIRNCNFNHCAIGLFINSKFLTHALSKNILIEKNVFTANGVIGDFHDHGLYVEAENVIYQYNFFDKLTDGALGASVKDRSAGNIFRYNWVNASKAHAVQIAEPQGGIGILDLLPSYKETFMYGNVFFSGVDGAVRNIRYGGDQGNYKYYRQGTLYFYNNTVIMERNKTLGPNNQYDISLFFMPDGGEILGGDTVTLKTKIDCRNNIIYIQPTAGSPSGTETSLFSILSTNLSGEVNMVNNWLSPGIADIYQFNAPGGGKKSNAGRVTHINSIYGNKGKNDPGFNDYANGDYSLSATSNAINGGTTLPTAATPYPVLEEYIKHLNTKVKTLVGTIDMGAFESPTDNLALPYPTDLTTTYGATDFNPGNSSNPNNPIPTLSSNSKVATIVAGKIHIIGAGKTVITAGAAGKEYLLNLTVNKATLTVHPNAAYRAVGTANPVFTLSYTGFVNGENEAVLTNIPTITTNATLSSPVAVSQYPVYNPYPIIASGGTAANYNLVYAEGVLTIYDVKASQTIYMQVENANVYGAADFDISATSNNATIPLTYVSSNDKVATIINSKIHITGVGKTTITVSQAGNNTFAAATNFVAQLTIDPAVLTIKADHQSKIINTANPTLTLTYDGFVYGQDQNSLTKLPTLSTTAQLNSPVGNYPITVSGATAINYVFKYLAGDLVVEPETLKTQTIKFDPIAPVNYGAADFMINASSDHATLPLTYTSSDPKIATIVGDKIHVTGAGTTEITVSQAGNANYLSAKDVVQTLGVNKAALSITANAQAKSLGSVNPPFSLSYKGFVYGENSAVLDPQPVVSSTATTSSPMGTYPITVSGAGANNYNITYRNGILTITNTKISILKSDIGNVVSANNDGVNDYWVIKNIELYPENSVKILDTTGRVIYQKKNYDNSWDGKYKGSPLSTNAYFYYIDLGNGTKFKGSVTIIP